MNRRLIVMRHAKSLWPDDSMSDHDRPLNARGRREASEVARRLVEQQWLPEVILSSDANRTRETWECMKPIFEAAGCSPIVQNSAELYLSGMNEAAAALSALDDTVQSVLLLGHNPGWEDVVAYLSGIFMSMTTANAALLQGESDAWSEALEHKSWQLVEVIRPREL